MEIKNLKIVLVEWEDATTIHDVSMSYEEAIQEKLVNVNSVGYLLKEYKDRIIISSFAFMDNENMDLYPKTLHIIPKKSIKNMFELKLK